MQGNRLTIDLTIVQRSVCAAAVTMLAACATRLDPAPIVDLSATPDTTVTQPAVSLEPPPPGYYRVKPGDTLSRIARDNRRSDSDIVAWNNLASPDQIEANQLLRVVPPGAGGVALKPAGSNVPVVGSGLPSAAPGAVSGSIAIPRQPGTDDVAVAGSGAIVLVWPARGPVLSAFDSTSNKGIDIGGATGDPVRAAAGGRVVYAGNGLRGYGNLIIVKDNGMFLTAYAHNRSLLVKEGSMVTQGQEIAEMGDNDSGRVMLHFELRRDGKPVDPLKFLPPQ